MLKAGYEGGDWRALESLVTRAHGKPVERIEQQAFGEIKSMSLDELRRLRGSLLDRYPELRAVE
jgi:hypothetical protein